MIRPLVRVAVITALLGLGVPPPGGPGSAAAQPPGGRGRGMAMMGMMMSHAALLRQEAVQAELGLSADQKVKLAEALPEAGRGGGNFREMSDEQRRAWMDQRRARQAEDDQKIAALVEPAQLGRLRQIRVQALGPAALLDDAIGKEIGVTDEQRTKIQESMQAAREQGGGGDRAEMRRSAYESVVKLLTTEQVAKLDGLRGPAFDVSKLQLRGPGGRRPGGGN
jgi:hypothetical protein